MERENLLQELNEVSEEIFYNNAFEELICSSEERVLWLIDNAGGSIYPKQLSELMRVTMPRITTILNGMDSKGLIDRKTAVQDRRKVVVSLTRKGRTVKKKYKKLIEDYNLKTMDTMTEEEMETVFKYLKAIREVQKEKNAVG